MTPGKCLIACHDLANGARYAMLSASGDCTCVPSIPPNYDGVPEDKCNVPCAGYPGQFCGGLNGEVSVYVAECPKGEIRFADHCYFMSDAGDTDIGRHQDACAKKASCHNCIL
jgi:hypothetical protein